MYFHNDNNNLPMNEFEIPRELNQLRQLGTFAGQESSLALSWLFNINILVTVGGDVENPNVVTLEHNFRNSESQIHLVWTRGRGGHYETVSENKTFKIQLSPRVNSFGKKIVVPDNLT